MRSPRPRCFSPATTAATSREQNCSWMAASHKFRPFLAEAIMTHSNQAGVTRVLYLDDLHVGQRFVSGAHLIDEEQIKAFANQFDPQPFHLDAEMAKETLFGGLVASGWHTASISMRLLVGSDLRIAGGLIGVNVEVSWPKPTRPGDILHVEGEIIELTPSRSRPDRGTATIRSETRNQRGEPVQVLVAKLVVPRRSNR